MLTVNPINFIKNRFQYKNLPQKAKEKAKTPPAGLYSLPFSCASNISFCALYANSDYTLKGQVTKLSPEQCPSGKILELANKILKENPNTKKTIFDVHNEYYAPLLACETLDEAKGLYPEFKDVVDASSLDINSDTPLALRYISRGKVEGVNIENASLMFLKQYYGKVGSPKKKEDFFGFGPTACHAALNALNIKKLDKSYVRLYSCSKPENRQKMSDTRIRVSTTPEYKKNASRASRQRWDRNDGAERRRAADTQRQVWAGLSKKEKQDRRDKQLAVQHTDEYRAKARERQKRNWENEEAKEAMLAGLLEFYINNPEYKEIKSQAWKAHPDILQVMSDTIKDFPLVPVIIRKKEAGNELTSSEHAIYMQYFAECKRRCPDMYKRANQTFSKMWKEYKEKKKD